MIYSRHVRKRNVPSSCGITDGIWSCRYRSSYGFELPAHQKENLSGTCWALLTSFWSPVNVGLILNIRVIFFSVTSFWVSVWLWPRSLRWCNILVVAICSISIWDLENRFTYFGFRKALPRFLTEIQWTNGNGVNLTRSMSLSVIWPLFGSLGIVGSF